MWWCHLIITRPDSNYIICDAIMHCHLFSHLIGSNSYDEFILHDIACKTHITHVMYVISTSFVPHLIVTCTFCTYTWTFAFNFSNPELGLCWNSTNSILDQGTMLTYIMEVTEDTHQRLGASLEMIPLHQSKLRVLCSFVLSLIVLVLDTDSIFKLLHCGMQG